MVAAEIAAAVAVVAAMGMSERRMLQPVTTYTSSDRVVCTHSFLRSVVRALHHQARVAHVLASSLLAFTEGFLPGDVGTNMRGMSGRNIPVPRSFRTLLARYASTAGFCMQLCGFKQVAGHLERQPLVFTPGRARQTIATIKEHVAETESTGEFFAGMNSRSGEGDDVFGGAAGELQVAGDAGVGSKMCVRNVAVYQRDTSTQTTWAPITLTAAATAAPTDSRSSPNSAAEMLVLQERLNSLNTSEGHTRSYNRQLIKDNAQLRDTLRELQLPKASVDDQIRTLFRKSGSNDKAAFLQVVLDALRGH